jgi:molecular chaperone DnaK (HSP70)
MKRESGRLELGIDFGTTRTVVSVCDRGNYPIVSFVGEDGESSDWYPSLLTRSGAAVRAGLDAERSAAEPGAVVTRSLKRLLARPDAASSTDADSPGRLLVTFLSALRDALRTRSNVAREAARADVIEVMVATPANAHGAQRMLTLDAFREAGFTVIGMLNEPSAAAFEYAHRYRSTLTARREKVGVYDLGGGTFDASLLSMTGRAHQVLAARGIGQLGGDDFDRILAELALRAEGIPLSRLGAPELDRLCAHCRELKERLHPSSKRIGVDVKSSIDPDARGAEPTIVQVSDYYAACEPLVERTLDVLSEVLEAGDPGELAGVYVVGGASSLPSIGRALRDRLGRRVHRSPYPSAAVAIGLAIALDEHAGYALEDRFSRVLGVFREADSGSAVTFDPLLGPDLVLPVSGEARVLEREYRAAHNVGHFRFVECSRVDALGQPSGEVTPYTEVLFPFDPALRERAADLSRIPVTRTGEPGARIRERYHVDAAGLVELTITDLDSGYEQSVRLGSEVRQISRSSTSS